VETKVTSRATVLQLLLLVTPAAAGAVVVDLHIVEAAAALTEEVNPTAEANPMVEEVVVANVIAVVVKVT